MKFKFWNTKGIVLEQKKEPALSRNIELFTNSDKEIKTIEPTKAVEKITFDKLIKICEKAKIIDERDGVELSKILKKSKRKSKIKCIVADAIDDEPYVSSQTNPMIKYASEAAFGLRILKNVYLAPKAYFAVYREMHYLNSRIPNKIEEFTVKRMGGKYPMEQRAVRRLGDDVLTVGVCALIHLARAIQNGVVQDTCFVTVAGNCIGTPCNMEVTIGTPVSEVIKHCGLIAEPTSISLGSAIKGTALKDDENTLIKANTSAIIAIKEAKQDLRRMDCIGCSRCVGVCPEGLNPLELYRAAKNNRRQTAKDLGIYNCIACSACSYICPSKLEISYTICSKREKWKKGEKSLNER